MNKKILIMEDDPFNKQFYDYFFKQTCYEIIQLENADEALEILNDENIGLVIMDINLTNTYLNGTKTDGVCISQKIKSNKETKSVPILLVTAYDINMRDKNIFRESLADDYIIKPITDFEQFLAKVKKLIT